MTSSWGISWLNSWANSWGLTSEQPAIRGGVADYHAYRKKLRKIAKAANKRLYSKVEKDVAKLAVSSAPDIVVATAKEIERTIDFAALSKGESILMAQQLDKLLIKLDELMAEAIIRNEEEELILLLAIV